MFKLDQEVCNYKKAFVIPSITRPITEFKEMTDNKKSYNQ